jgi:hypothetical protein
MRYIFLFLLAFSFAACSGPDTDGKTDSVDTAAMNLLNGAASDWQSLTESWTASLNLKNASIMKSFYADSVLYYGDKISGNDVVNRQQVYFLDNPDYHQKIVEYISEDQLPDGTWRIRLTKQVRAGGKTANYPASLVYGKENGIWKIIAESDDITDLRKAQPVTVHYAPEKVTVEGLLEENSGFVSPEGNDQASDGKQTYYVIWASQPLDVIGPDDPKTLLEQQNITELGMERIQVVGDDKEIAALLNKKVRATGTLFHAHLPEHFTPVVLEVEELKAAVTKPVVSLQ